MQYVYHREAIIRFERLARVEDNGMLDNASLATASVPK